MDILLMLIAIAAGLGSLVCFVIVMIYLFQSDQAGFALMCIFLLFVCGIGGLIAYVKGWMDELGMVMWAWTACIVVSIVARAALFGIAE